MNKRSWAVVMSVIMVAFLAGCAVRQPPAGAFMPLQLSPAAFSKKVDTFVVVMDVSSSMNITHQEHRKIDHATQIVSLINQMIPPMDYRAVSVAIRSGSCFNCEDALLLYGPAPYNRAGFNAALDDWKSGRRARRISFMLGGNELILAMLQEDPGRVAMLIVSDAESIFHGRSVMTAQKMKGVLGDRLCIYPIQMGRDGRARIVMDKLANLGGCGFAVNADEIASPEAMAEYVSGVFLASARVPAGAAQAASDQDSDGDGVPDSRDQCPNTPRGVRAGPDGCWVPPAVYFDPGQVAIKDARALDDAVAVLKTDPGLTGEVHGHTDSSASSAYNLKLSEARAEALRGYFVNRGIASERIRVRGFGETRPAASNDNAAGRALNRRAEFHPAGR